jgi:hypothetical protein
VTYHDKAAATMVLEAHPHTVQLHDIPKAASPKPSTEQKPLESSADSKVTLQVSPTALSLGEEIRSRMDKSLQRNRAARSMINKRVLGDFEGFNGELRRLWDEVHHTAREETVSKIAKDRLRNGKGLLDESVSNRKGEDFLPLGRRLENIIEATSNLPLEETTETSHKLLSDADSEAGGNLRPEDPFQLARDDSISVGGEDVVGDLVVVRKDIEIEALEDSLETIGRAISELRSDLEKNI